MNAIKTAVLVGNPAKGLGIPDKDNSFPSDAPSPHKGCRCIYTQTRATQISICICYSLWGRFPLISLGVEMPATVMLLSRYQGFPVSLYSPILSSINFEIGESTARLPRVGEIKENILVGQVL